MDTEALGRKALTDVLVNQMKISKSYASGLVRDHKTPSYEMALRIEQTTGIPLGFWRSENRGAAMWARIQEKAK